MNIWNNTNVLLLYHCQMIMTIFVDIFIPSLGKYGNIFFENLNFFFSEIALKLSKSPYFFYIFTNFSFLNRTLGLRKSFLNQTTYVLKNRLYQQSFLNRDSFLNRAFLNRDSTVLTLLKVEGNQSFYLNAYSRLRNRGR